MSKNHLSKNVKNGYIIKYRKESVNIVKQYSFSALYK